MTDTILIAASMRIERPAAEVSAQYRDMDHHIRNNVHPGIKIQWEPSDTGQRKVRMTFRLLGLKQFDVAVLEDAPDGIFVIRYLEGTNTGMFVTHQFVPLGPDATEVKLEAHAPSTLGRKLLGPLFVVGARQVLKKALVEDKRDLEKGAFKAGIAAGAIEAALEPLQGLADKSEGGRRTVVAAARLVSSCDGEVDSAEANALKRLATLLGMEGTLAGAVDIDAVATEAQRIGDALRAAGLAEEGVLAGAVIGLVSQGMSLGELSVLRKMALAAGMAEERIAEVVEAADKSLMAGAA